MTGSFIQWYVKGNNIRSLKSVLQRYSLGMIRCGLEFRFFGLREIKDFHLPP